jgi:predicted metal-dependent phosphoesterase TrpH
MENKTYLNLPLNLIPESSGKVKVSGLAPLANGHIHTPYSFSAFSGMEQAFRMAKEEKIIALGINDFYTTDGYAEFAGLALQYRVFPLFNIEFMALLKEEQQSGTKVNDPVNPGRTYLSGKGLRFPVRMSEESRLRMEKLLVESNRQIVEMVAKLNGFLASVNTGIGFVAEEIREKYARNLLRERHIASAFRIAAEERYTSEKELRDFYALVFQSKEPKSALTNSAALENEIRNNLLKAGGPAFVPEDENAFLNLEQVLTLIKDAGGIPCYPVLLDDPKGKFTDFEGDWPRMADKLEEMNISMIELIPGRNDFQILKEFVRYFDSRGFVITFGTEHNTPQLDPLTISCRGGVPLDEELSGINFRGVAIIAAHQYLTANVGSGFPVDRKPTALELEQLENIGSRIISIFTQE